MSTRMSVALAWLRVLAGLGIATHGYQKIFGGMMPRFTEGVAALGFPMPHLFAWMAALSELAGGLMLVLGLLTPLAALMVFGTMTVAAFLQHGSDPFDVKELALAYWTMAGTLMVAGGGKYSLDALIFRKCPISGLVGQAPRE